VSNHFTPGFPATEQALASFIRDIIKETNDRYKIYSPRPKAAVSLTKNSLYYLSPPSPYWALAKASTNAFGSDRLLAIACGARVSDGMLVRGRVKLSLHAGEAPILNFEQGKVIYMSISTGRMDTVAPTGSGEIVRVVGHCLTVSRKSDHQYFYFNPEPGWLELV
jgi:hypothetical protein